MTIHNVAETFEENAGWSGSGAPGSAESQASRRFTVSVSSDTHSAEVLRDLRIPQENAVLAVGFNRMRCRSS